MRLLSIALIVLACAVGALAAPAPTATPKEPDVRIEGWAQVKWGMTVEQVRAAYPQAAAPTPGSTPAATWEFTYGNRRLADLVLRDVPVVGGPWTVLFFFEYGRLHDVVLRPQAKVTVQQARELAAGLRDRYHATVSEYGTKIFAAAMPAAPSLAGPARVEFRYDADAAMNAYVQYDCTQHFLPDAHNP